MSVYGCDPMLDWSTVQVVHSTAATLKRIQW